jgi:hypothetical protein
VRGKTKTPFEKRSEGYLMQMPCPKLTGEKKKPRNAIKSQDAMDDCVRSLPVPKRKGTLNKRNQGKDKRKKGRT